MLSKNLLIIDKLILALPDDFKGGINAALDCVIQYRQTEDAMLENKGGNFVLTAFDIPDDVNPDDPAQLTKEALMKYMAENEDKVMTGVITVAEFDEELGGYRNKYTKQEEKTYQKKKAEYLNTMQNNTDSDDDDCDCDDDMDDEDWDTDSEVSIPPYYKDVDNAIDDAAKPLYRIVKRDDSSVYEESNNIMRILTIYWNLIKKLNEFGKDTTTYEIHIVDPSNGASIFDVVKYFNTKVVMDNFQKVTIIDAIDALANTACLHQIFGTQIEDLSDHAMIEHLVEWYTDYDKYLTRYVCSESKFWQMFYKDIGHDVGKPIENLFPLHPIFSAVRYIDRALKLRIEKCDGVWMPTDDDHPINSDKNDERNELDDKVDTNDITRLEFPFHLKFRAVHTFNQDWNVDCRGTFTDLLVILSDPETGMQYTPLAKYIPNPATSSFDSDKYPELNIRTILDEIKEGQNSSIVQKFAAVYDQCKRSMAYVEISDDTILRVVINGNTVTQTRFITDDGILELQYMLHSALVGCHFTERVNSIVIYACSKSANAQYMDILRDDEGSSVIDFMNELSAKLYEIQTYCSTGSNIPVEEIVENTSTNTKEKNAVDGDSNMNPSSVNLDNISYILAGTDRADAYRGNVLISCLLNYADPNVQDEYSIFAFNNTSDENIPISVESALDEAGCHDLPYRLRKLVARIINPLYSEPLAGSSFILYPFGSGDNPSPMWRYHNTTELLSGISYIMNEILRLYCTRKDVGDFTVMYSDPSGNVRDIFPKDDEADKLFKDIAAVFHIICDKVNGVIS